MSAQEAKYLSFRRAVRLFEIELLAELVRAAHLGEDNACRGWVSMLLMMQRRISVKGRAKCHLVLLDKGDKKSMISAKRQKI